MAGKETRTPDLATEHLPVVTAMVRLYVPDAGLIDGIPDNDLAALIVTSTARYVSTPPGPTLTIAVNNSENPRRSLFGIVGVSVGLIPYPRRRGNE